MLENNENNGAMESVSANAPKERKSVINDADLAPIEVESTLHIEKEKHEQVKHKRFFLEELFGLLATVLFRNEKPVKIRQDAA